MNITWTPCIFAQWLHMHFESWGNFQNESLPIFNIDLKFWYHAKVRTRDFTLFKEHHCHLSCRCSMFTDWRRPVCVWINSLFSIRDLFLNRTSDTCKIQPSRLDRILWSYRWWKVVPSQIFPNIIIRNFENVQVFEDSQILLASSGGFIGCFLAA